MTEALKTRAPTGGPAWLSKLRGEAMARFEALGFPTTRDEAWRFTDVSAIAKMDLPLAPAGTNGAIAPDAEPHLGRTASFDRNAFAALNTAFVQDVVFVHLRGDAAEPIAIPFRSKDGFATHPRVLVVAEAGARATIVESHAGPEGAVYFTNAVTEIVLGEGATIDYVKLQRESKSAFHVATLAVRQAAGARFTSHAVTLGAALSRHDVTALLDGEGAETTLNGLYEIGGAQHADSHTTIDHAKPHGTSRELYKGVLSGEAHAVFDGRIVVRPGAQKTNAVQTNRNLLLSKRALVNTKPQLEIFANDVKCKHGATIGRLDEEVLFYLRSRGIGLEEARRLLIIAFAGEVVDRLPVESIRDELDEALFAMVPA